MSDYEVLEVPNVLLQKGAAPDGPAGLQDPRDAESGSR